MTVRGPPGNDTTAILEGAGRKIGSIGDGAGATQGGGAVEMFAFTPSIAARTLTFSFRCCSTSKLHASVRATI